MRMRAFGVLVALLAASSAAATPRYSMQVGQKCSLCHVNPSGGGMRSLYGSQYLLPARIALQTEGAPSPPDPQIGDHVVLGTDLRTFYFQENRDRLDNFAQMQAAVYLSLQLDERFSAYIHEEFGQSQTNVQAYEAFGTANVASGYVKIGKFVPAYGWRYPDHRSFVRRTFVYLPDFPPHSDTGIEIGWRPKSFLFQASIVNGAYTGGFDPDRNVAFVGRGVWRWSRGGFNLAVGGSYFHNETGSETRDAGGPFAGLHWKRLTWTGELDWARVARSPGRRTSVTTTSELAFHLVQGFDAVGTYDFHDPDTDLTTGAVQRVGGGLDLIPYPFLALRARVNVFLLDEGSDTTTIAGFPQDLTEDVTQFTGEIQFFF